MLDKLSQQPFQELPPPFAGFADYTDVGVQFVQGNAGSGDPEIPTQEKRILGA